MTPAAPDLPDWAAILVAAFVLAGSLLTLIGSLGLARLRTFYDRIHAPTMGSSAGVGFISLASILCFSVLGSRLIIHEALIFIFITITTPVALMLLARASLFRDRVEGNDPVPEALERIVAGSDADAVLVDDRRAADEEMSVDDPAATPRRSLS